MKEILKGNWIYLLLILGLLILTIMQVSTFRYGFFTAYDEAYFLLKLQEAYDMSCITGKSQWNLIAIHWFPYLDLTDKVNSLLATSILLWTSIIIITTTACVLYDKKQILKYFALSWLILYGLTSGLSGDLSYGPMQTAVLCWALCAFMLFQNSKVVWKKSLYACVCGICFGLSLFIVLPSAILLLVCVALLIAILYWQDWRRMLMYIGSGVAGGLLALLYMQIFVCPIDDIVDAMRFTATYIGKSGYNYGAINFLAQYALFARDCIFVIITFVGVYWLSIQIKNKWLGGLLYVGAILLYAHYQQKPIVSPSMIMMSAPLLPFLFGESQDTGWRVLKEGQAWFYIFVFMYPVLASLGTNTLLSEKITCFAYAWLLLWFDYESKHSVENYGRVIIAIVILFMLPLGNTVQKYTQRDDSCHFTRGNTHFAKIAITKQQADYFNHVYDILEKYNFQPNQSAILTACYDYCSLYAFDAVNAANYHQVQNFRYFPKDKMIEPDFIFLCGWDSIVMAEDLKAMPWGWPEEFDQYYVGTPEPENAPWIVHRELETRTLYCRRVTK